MADKIPIYGELDCRTAENIIADATQIRYDATKNVKENETITKAQADT